MGNRWLEWGGLRGDDFDARIRERERAGHDVHGEARLVESLGPRRVLDAGCGTGRVAIELAARGLEVVGVDVDPAMLASARAKAPALTWVEADLSRLDLRDPADPSAPRRFDAAVMAGNVMIFLAPGSEGEVLRRLALHLVDGGLVVAGFQLLRNRGELTADGYDELAAAAGLEAVERWATWDRQPWTPASRYLVAVHRRRG